MRRMMLAMGLALALTACGGEKYPLPAGQAYEALTSVGADGVSPLRAMGDVSLNVDSTPADSSVRWRFTRDGAELGAIVATIEPDGDQASIVSTEYIEGSAPDDNRNADMRGLIQGGMRQLIEESIRARFEGRPVNTELRKSLEIAAMQANIGGMMEDASASMEKAAKDFDDAKRESESRAATNPYTKTAPMTDLSKFDKP